LNRRDFGAATEELAEDAKFHAPGIGLDVEGRDVVAKHIREFIEQADARYEVEHIVEHGPFVVTFTRCTGNLDDRRMAWDLCQVAPFEGDRIAEIWALRGGTPVAFD
jgi:hypothetical protein